MNIPLPGDYFESRAESERINEKTGLTWYEEYLRHVKAWNRLHPTKQVKPFKFKKPVDKR